MADSNEKIDLGDSKAKIEDLTSSQISNRVNVARLKEYDSDLINGTHKKEFDGFVQSFNNAKTLVSKVGDAVEGGINEGAAGVFKGIFGMKTTKTNSFSNDSIYNKKTVGQYWFVLEIDGIEICAFNKCTGFGVSIEKQPNKDSFTQAYFRNDPLYCSFLYYKPFTLTRLVPLGSKTGKELMTWAEETLEYVKDPKKEFIPYKTGALIIYDKGTEANKRQDEDEVYIPIQKMYLKEWKFNDLALKNDKTAVFEESITIQPVEMLLSDKAMKEYFDPKKNKYSEMNDNDKAIYRSQSLLKNQGKASWDIEDYSGKGGDNKPSNSFFNFKNDHIDSIRNKVSSIKKNSKVNKEKHVLDLDLNATE